MTEPVTKPPKLERCVSHLMEQGHSEESAYAICNATLDLLAEPEEEAAATPVVIKSIEKVEDGKQMLRKYYVSETKALKNGDIESYVSTEAVDRVGDVIKAKGWQLDNYKKTGAPVLFSHDYSQPPIGKAIEIEVQRKGLWAITRFHEKTQQSRDLAMLAREGDMKSWSVGFNPIDKPEMRKDTDGNFAGYIFKTQELLEYSLVAVPANPEAISKAIRMAQRGLISHEMVSIIAGPSPLAREGSVFDGNPGLLRAAQEKQIHSAKIVANHFMKGILNGRRG
jgi:HK97 family phage prohead protease